MSHYLAFDYGLARIGVAVGQSITQTAEPLDILKANQGTPDWTLIERLIEQWQPAKIIVGEPFNMDGTDQQITIRARKFANRLHGRFGLVVELFDERLSSAMAREELFERGGYRKLKKSQLDSVAAVHILESWFAYKTDT